MSDSALVGLLPKAKHSVAHEIPKAQKESKIVPTSGVPKIGQRQGWVPRSIADFEDGGAFPEIHVAQYPLGMGLERNKTNALAPTLDSAGKINFDAVAKQGQRDNRIIYSRLEDMKPRAVDENDPSMQKPEGEDSERVFQETQSAIDNILNRKTENAAFHPVGLSNPLIYRHTPSQQGMAFNSGAKQRLIRVFEAQKDPIEPSRFRINRKIPRGPPSPPAPVLRSPERKPTQEELQQWRIPPCISNWKNNRGFTVPLDKRLAADGRGLQTLHINEKFAKFSEALYIADRKSREEVEKRNQYHQRVATKAREKEEERLRLAAEKAREEKKAFKPVIDDPGYAEREEYRTQKQHERQRERNIARRNPNRAQRERDISEKIAIGLPNPHGGRGDSTTQFDARLFNQPQGLDTGFHEGDDEGYNVYDKPWRSDVGSQIYRPSKSVIDRENYGDDLEKEIRTNRFVKGFKGADKEARADGGPVQFEKDEDPFGLTKFLSDAKSGNKRRGEDREAHDSKRRK